MTFRVELKDLSCDMEKDGRMSFRQIDRNGEVLQVDMPIAAVLFFVQEFQKNFGSIPVIADFKDWFGIYGTSEEGK